MPLTNWTAILTFCTVISIFFHRILQIPCFLTCVACFCNVFLQDTVIYTFVAIKPFQNSFLQCFQFPCLPEPLKTPLFTLCSSIFPCANAAGQLKHIYKKSFKNIVCFQCFCIFFRQKHRNLHVFRHKVGPKHWFLQCFQGSGIQKPFKISQFTIYSVFSFVTVFLLQEATKMTTQKSSKKFAKTPPIPGLGAKSFLGTRSRCEIVFAPPPSKADIATAIWTNVIEHLVWLFAPQ